MGNLSIGTPSSYADWARRGSVYTALGNSLSVSAYNATSGIGGPLLWNSSSINGPQEVLVYLLAVGAAVTTASAVATLLGITGAGGQTAAPTSTGGITVSGNNYVGGTGNKSSCNVYSFGTVTKGGTFFMPTHTLDTGAITSVSVTPALVDIGGAVMVPPGSWISPCAAATPTSAVLSIALVWCEVPL